MKERPTFRTLLAALWMALLLAPALADIYTVEPVWKELKTDSCRGHDGYAVYFDRIMQQASPLVTALESFIQRNHHLPETLGELDVDNPRVRVKNWSLWRSADSRTWLVFATVIPPESPEFRDEIWTLCYCSSTPPRGFTGWKATHLIECSGHWGLYVPR